MTQDGWPATAEDALAEGFARLPQDELSRRYEKGLAAGDPPSPPLCMTSPRNTRCHNVVHANGDRVVGFCNGAGQCILYLKRAGRDHDD